ncbi:phosphopantetheine attachment domain protein [Eubacterium nodatum ATCC 33099]|nr:phosphopantetheine attachment domain protein [Eubacterium nodatum ATCC 33099]
MNEVLEILEDLRPDVDFKEEKALVSDGILDSIDIISLVQELDEEFDITIKPADLIPENFNSVEAISKLVEKLMED